MLKPRLIVLVLIVAVGYCSAVAQKISKESIVSQGKKRTYYLYVPKSVNPSTAVPLVVLFHGSNRNGLTLAEKWKELADREGLIIIAPDSLKSSEWAVPVDGPLFLQELVESIKGRQAINPRKVYLFGHSGGAIFALLMSLYESEYFAATAVHAGALHSNAAAVLDQAKRKIPMQIQVGTNDSFFPLTVVRITRDALQSRGFPVELLEIEGHDHWYYDRASKINDDAWTFLKAHQLPADPRFEEYKFAIGQRSTEATEYYAKGIERQRANDFTSAIAAYTRAIELDAKFADAYNNRGVAYLNQQNQAAALADFTRSIDIDPSAAAYNNRANIHFSQKRFPEAIADFSAAIKLSPSVDAHINRGTAYLQTNEHLLALQDFDRAIQLDPKSGRAYLLRGIAHLQAGNGEAAQKDLDKGFSLDSELHREFDPIIKQMQPRE